MEEAMMTGGSVSAAPQSTGKIRVSMSPALKMTQPPQKFAVRSWLDDCRLDEEVTKLKAREPQEKSFECPPDSAHHSEYYFGVNPVHKSVQPALLETVDIVESLISFLNLTESLAIRQVSKRVFIELHSKVVTKHQRYLIVNIGLTRVERLRLWYNKT